MNWKATALMVAWMAAAMFAAAYWAIEAGHCERMAGLYEERIEIQGDTLRICHDRIRLRDAAIERMRKNKCRGCD